MGKSDAERLAILETQFATLTKKIDEQDKLIREMHATLLHARGAKWAVVSLIGAAGLVGAFASKIGAWAMALPRI